MAPDRDAALDHLTAKVSDHSTALQAMQVDIHHMVKAIDKLVGVSEKQAVLGAELSRHGESLDRAFRQMDGHKSEFVAAIDRLTDSLKQDREAAGLTAKQVAGFQQSIRTARWLGAGYGVLLAVIFGMYTTGIKADQARIEGDVSLLRAAFDTRKQATDIKIDALSQQVQEVRLDRQRDRESEGMQP